MKKTSVLIAVLLLLLCAGEAANAELPPVSKIRPGVASEGSLANAKLQADASHALLEQLQIPTAERPQTKILKFVIQQPVGSSGKKAWREMWVVMRAAGGGRFIVTFKENGRGSADFTFEGQKK